MIELQIYKYEGGYRIAFEICNGGPVIKSSPWFDTLNKARLYRERKRIQGMRANEIASAIFEYGEYYSKDAVKEIKRRYAPLVRAAKAVRAEDDPE